MSKGLLELDMAKEWGYPKEEIPDSQGDQLLASNPSITVDSEKYNTTTIWISVNDEASISDFRENSSKK